MTMVTVMAMIVMATIVVVVEVVGGDDDYKDADVMTGALFPRNA